MGGLLAAPAMQLEDDHLRLVQIRNDHPIKLDPNCS